MGEAFSGIENDGISLCLQKPHLPRLRDDRPGSASPGGQSGGEACLLGAQSPRSQQHPLRGPHQRTAGTGVLAPDLQVGRSFLLISARPRYTVLSTGRTSFLSISCLRGHTARLLVRVSFQGVSWVVRGLRCQTQAAPCLTSQVCRYLAARGVPCVLAGKQCRTAERPCARGSKSLWGG